MKIMIDLVDWIIRLVIAGTMLIFMGTGERFVSPEINNPLVLVFFIAACLSVWAESRREKVKREYDHV